MKLIDIKLLTEARHINSHIDTGFYTIYDNKERKFVDEIGRNLSIRHMDYAKITARWVRFTHFNTKEEALESIERVKEIAFDEYPDQARKNIHNLDDLQIVRLVAIPE